MPNRFVNYGDNVSLVDRGKYPDGLPGRTLGETDSALIQEWRWMPANYMFAVHLDGPPPLSRRIDDPNTGLAPGLQMITESMTDPIRHSQWSNRYGFGCANRLNGVAVQFNQSGSYSPPAAYNY